MNNKTEPEMKTQMLENEAQASWTLWQKAHNDHTTASQRYHTYYRSGGYQDEGVRMDAYLVAVKAKTEAAVKRLFTAAAAVLGLTLPLKRLRSWRTLILSP